MRTIPILALALALAGPAAAQFTPMATAVPDSVPGGMNYQGRLEKDGFPVTGSRTMAFRLYDASSGGTALYNSGNMAVAVQQGIFAVSLDIPFGALTGTAQKYLELEVEGIVLTPRDALRSVPYAKVAETVEGTINISTAGLTFTTNVGDSLAISSGSGRVGIGTASPAARLHVSSGAGETGTILLVSTGASALATVDGNGVVTANSFVGDGTNLRNVVRRSGDSMSGSLTLNGSTLTVGGSGFSVAGSEFTVGSGRTGVGTASPLAVLTVVGDSSFSQPSTFLSSVTVASSAQFGSGATRSTFSTTGALALDSKARLSVGTTFYVDNGAVQVAAAAGSTYAMRLNGDLLIGNVDAHDLTAGSDVHVEGNVILDGRLIQHGTTGTSLDNLGVLGAATFKGSATVVGAVGVGGTLGVAGTATLTSSVSALGNLGVNGLTMMKSSLTVRERAEFGLTGVSSFSAAGGLTMAAGQNIRLTANGEVLGLPATPTVDDAAASKAYVNSQVLGGLSGWTRDTVNSEVELSNAGDKVGINTTSPLAKLHVVGDLSVTTFATFGNSVTVRNAASFGTTGQSSFNSTGVLTLGTQLAVASGGTGGTTQATAQTALDVPARDGTGASGTWGIGISGNAATATALSANPTDAASGRICRGITASGACEPGEVDAAAVNGSTNPVQSGALFTHANLGGTAHSATSANTVSAIVARDGSGNFSAGTISAALSGNATTASALAADPSACGAGTFTTDIAANGTLTCSSVGAASVAAGSLATTVIAQSVQLVFGTKAVLMGTTPGAVGKLYYCSDCTGGGGASMVVISTGAAAGQFASVLGGAFQ